MKAIEFNAVNAPMDPTSAVVQHQLYSVLLGNGVRCFFSSDRHAAQFNAATERVLNDALFRANLLLADVYPAWRLAWYYLDTMPERDRQAARSIREAEDAMDRALRRRGGPDRIHFAWKDVTTALAAMRDLLLALIELYRKKGHGVERQRLDVMLSHANACIDGLRQWGSTDTDAPNATAITRT